VLLPFRAVYPGHNCPWDWESGMLRIYIDGSSTPTIDITLLQLASVPKAADIGDATPQDVAPFSARLFGKNARTGGVWSTMRIPFGTSIRVTIEQAATCDAEGTYWFIIRGVEGLGVTLSELELPASARLVMAKNRQAPCARWKMTGAIILAAAAADTPCPHLPFPSLQQRHVAAAGVHRARVGAGGLRRGSPLDIH
jgi:hypothetical protein